MKILLSVFLIFFMVDLPAQPLRYIPTEVVNPPVIDGDLSDEGWSEVAWSTLFTPLIAKDSIPNHETKFKVIWDDLGLYFGVLLKEDDLQAQILRDDLPLHLTDPVIELFIDPSGDGRRYYELQINANNTSWQLMMPKSYQKGGKAVSPFHLEQMTSEVYHQGTVNDSIDRDEFWSVEVFIPWEAFKRLNVPALPPRSNDVWRINLARVYQFGEQQHYSSWSKIPKRNLHLPDHWGFIKWDR